MVSPTSPTGNINGCLAGWNGDFSGNPSPGIANGLVTNGQLWIGSTTANANGTFINVGTLTPGPGVTITNGPGSITIGATGAAFAYTNVNHAASPYTVLAGDDYISVDCSGGVVTLLFPNAPTANRTWIIKDRTGNAAASNISITTVGGTVTIDGSTTYKIVTNYGSVQMLANATPTYEVY